MLKYSVRLSGTGLVGPLPQNLFDNQPLLNSSQFLAMLSMSTTLTSSLYASAPLLSNAGAGFFQCPGIIGPLPQDLFGTGRNITTLSSVFLLNTLSSIPGNVFGPQPKCINIQGLFSSSPSVTSIGSGLLDGFTNVENMDSTFSGCSNLTSLPIGLWNSIGSKLKQANGIFQGSSIDASSIDDFLITMDINKTQNSFVSINYSGTLSGGHLDANRSPAALVAKNSLITKGWLVSGVY